MVKFDSRIKIFNNDRNRGLLYSRAMGILNSKGEYLMNLDPDDELVDRENLKYLYNIAKKLKVDVISFGLIKQNNYNSSNLFLCSKFNNITFQPEIFDSNGEIFDYLITNKLIKKELFKKVYRLIKKQIYGEKWNYAEDEIWSSLINKFAKSKICINKLIYLYHVNKYSLIENKNNTLHFKNLINWIKMLKKIFINKNEKIFLKRFRFVIYLIRKNINFINIIKSNSKIKDRYINIFKEVNFKMNNSFLNYIINSLKN